MPEEMLEFGAAALAVAMAALLVVGSNWVQHRIRARLQKRRVVTVIEKAEADPVVKVTEAAGHA